MQHPNTVHIAGYINVPWIALSQLHEAHIL